MMKDKRGFIAISVIYSFFLVFLMLLLIIINSYINNRTSFDVYKENIKLKAAKSYGSLGNNTTYLTDEIKKQIDLTKSLNSGVNYDGSTYGSYRYFGQVPNNYICFGKHGNSCNDERYLFRIVGVFKESNVAQAGGSGFVTKIVRAKPIAKRSYDESEDGHFWADSSLKKYLNETYLESNLDAGFEDLFKNEMIIEAKWYAPAHTTYTITTAKAYTSQMKATGSYVSSGKIGLLSISDWGYASKSIGVCDITNHTLDKYNDGFNYTCHLYNWLNSEQWFIDNYKNGSEAMTLTTGDNKNNLTSADVTSSKLVYPAFYINSKVVVMAGTGTKVDPYIINLFEV